MKWQSPELKHTNVKSLLFVYGVWKKAVSTYMKTIILFAKKLNYPVQPETDCFDHSAIESWKENTISNCPKFVQQKLTVNCLFSGNKKFK